MGGIFTGKDAYDKILAGASAVQIYTALIYHGPPVVSKIKNELAELLEKDGYNSVNEAIGKGVKWYIYLIRYTYDIEIFLHRLDTWFYNKVNKLFTCLKISIVKAPVVFQYLKSIYKINCLDLDWTL